MQNDSERFQTIKPAEVVQIFMHMFNSLPV